MIFKEESVCLSVLKYRTNPKKGLESNTGVLHCLSLK